MRKPSALLLPLLLLLLSGASAQAQHAFQVLLPGLDPAEKRPVVQTADGGFCILAKQENTEAELSKFVLIKTNSDGMIEWARRYAPEGSNDYPTALRRTADGGFLAVGTTTVPGSWDQDILVLRLNEHGYPLWSRTYNQSNLDWAADAVLLEDGSAVIVGSTEALDSILEAREEWNEEMQEYEISEGFEYTYSSSTRSFVFRIDPDGEVLWGNSISEFPDSEENQGEFEGNGSYCQTICVKDENSFAVVEQVSRDYSFHSSLVVNITNDGEASTGLWMPNGSTNDDLPFANFVNDIVPSGDGGTLLAGITRYYSDTYETMIHLDQGFLMRLDEKNEILWNKTYDADGNVDPLPLTIAPLDKEHFIIAGRTLFSNGFHEDGDNPVIGIVDQAGKVLEAKQWITSFSGIPVEQTEEGNLQPFLWWPLFTPTDDQGILSVGAMLMRNSDDEEYSSGSDPGMIITRFNPDLTLCGDQRTESTTIRPGSTKLTNQASQVNYYAGWDPIDVTENDYRTASPGDYGQLVAAPDIVDMPKIDYVEPAIIETNALVGDTFAVNDEERWEGIKMADNPGNIDVANITITSPPADEYEYDEFADTTSMEPVPFTESIEPPPPPFPVPAPDTMAFYYGERTGDYYREEEEETITDLTTSGPTFKNIEVVLNKLEVTSISLTDMAVEEFAAEPYFLCQDHASPLTASSPSTEESINSDYLRLMPNSVAKGKSVALEFHIASNEKPEVSLISIGRGEVVRQLSEKNILWSEAESVGGATIETAGLAAGVYLVQVRAGVRGKQLSAKLEVR